MKEDHANMPGMGNQAKKPEQGKAATTSEKGQPPKKPDASAPSDKARPQGSPKTP